MQKKKSIVDTSSTYRFVVIEKVKGQMFGYTGVKQVKCSNFAGNGLKLSRLVNTVQIQRLIFILFYFILFYFILFYFILFYFILFYFILFSYCRPSVLLCLSKLLERLILRCIEFIDINNILNDKEYGFGVHHSTCMAINATCRLSK